MSQTGQIEIQDKRIESDAMRIAQMMGLSNWREMNDLALVKRVETGLPLKAVERIAHVINPDDKKAKYTILSRSTYSRLRKKQKNQLSKDMSEKLHGIVRVIAETKRLWNDDAKAVTRFLNRPHPLLDGRTPFDLARESTVGADLVIKIIGEARAGVAV